MNTKLLTRLLILFVGSLVLVGSLLVFSATGNINYFQSHIIKAAIAALFFLAFSMIPYGYYKKYSKYALLFSVILLLLTPIIGVTKNGATRWIEFGFLSFQPSELAKIVLIMHLAAMIEKKGEDIRDFKKGFRYTLFWILLICALVIIQPNVSTSLIIAGTSFTLLFVGGAKLKHIGITLGTGIVTAAAAVYLFFPHAMIRIDKFINGSTNQVKQAKIALGSGGFIGLGLGNSRQSNSFVPEPYGDFIFSILGEELGFAGTFIVLTIYLALFFIGVIIAKKAKDTFGQLLGFGLSFMIVSSAFINAGVVTGMLPTTGITLPFISFGGTSLLIFAVSVAILLNIAISASRENRTEVTAK